TGYTWSRSTLDGPVARITVTTTGVHVLNLWMREDGTVVDKIVLTTNANYVPTGLGPPESGRSPNGPAARAPARASATSPVAGDPGFVRTFPGTRGGSLSISTTASSPLVKWADLVHSLPQPLADELAKTLAASAAGKRPGGLSPQQLAVVLE